MKEGRTEEHIKGLNESMKEQNNH